MRNSVLMVAMESLVQRLVVTQEVVEHDPGLADVEESGKVDGEGVGPLV